MIYYVIVNILRNYAASSAAADYEASTDTDTSRLVAVIVVSSVYGFVMLVLVGAYHLFLVPFSGGVGRGAAAAKKRASASATDSAPDAATPEQSSSTPEKVLSQLVD